MADKTYKLELTLSDGTKINAGTITAPQGEKGDKGDKGDSATIYRHIGYLIQNDQAQECTAEIQVVWYSKNADASWDELSDIVANATSFYPASGYISINNTAQGNPKGIVIGIGTLIEGEDMSFHYVNAKTGEKGVFSTQSGILCDELLDSEV